MIYYDAFTNEYVKEKIELMPPERYCEVVCSSTDSYKETWFVGKDKLLDIPYSKQDIKDVVVHKKRLKLAEENNCILQYIVKWEVPEEDYKEIQNHV